MAKSQTVSSQSPLLARLASEHGVEKLATTAWYWAEEQMRLQNWGTFATECDKYFDIYKGKHWEQENENFASRQSWPVVYNETGNAINAHVAQMLAIKPRHYHTNIDPNIIEQKALNAFLVRATAKDTYNFRRRCFQIGNIYPGAVLKVGMDMYASPIGLGPGHETLPMPTYTVDEPWRWIIDPGNNGDISKSRWAIRFSTIAQSMADRMAGREVSDEGKRSCYDVKQKFMSKLVSTTKIRNTALALVDDESVLTMEIYFRDVKIGCMDGVKIETDAGWHFMRVIGDYVSYLDLSPYGDKVGLPISIFTPQPLPGYLWGMAGPQAAWPVQRDINARRSRAREIDFWNRGVMAVYGSGANDARKKLLSQMGSGVVALQNGIKLDHIRGDKVDQAMYNEIQRTEGWFQKLFGVPNVLQGYNETGSYSAQQTGMLQQAANTMMAWKNNEYGIAVQSLGEKEFEMLKYFWAGYDKIALDTGTEMVIISTEILEHSGWGVQVVPEDTYVQLMNAENQVIMQLFANGIVPPQVALQHISALSPEEKQSTLQWLQMQQAAQAQAQQGGQPAK